MREEKSRIINAFPSYLGEDIESIYKKFLLESSIIHNTGAFKVVINNEEIEIPNRINLDEANYISCSPIQQCILDCYYTRHCDGFIREKYLKRIITYNREWVVPYVIQLLGEYVIEILSDIYDELDYLDIKLYRQFIMENQMFYNLIKQRVASYWNCYYRWEYKYKMDYVGFKILNFIDTAVTK